MVDVDALNAFVLSQVGEPFRWGSTDCVSVSLRALAVAHRDEVLPHPGYTSYRSARKVFAAIGRDVAGVLREAGATELTTAHMQPGDLVLLPELDVDLPQMGIATSSDQIVLSNPNDRLYTVRLRDIPTGATVWRF